LPGAASTSYHAGELNSGPAIAFEVPSSGVTDPVDLERRPDLIG